MPTLRRLIQTPRFPYCAVFVIGCILFGGAVYLGEALGLAACPLCILQRMASLGLMIAAGIGIALAGSRTGSAIANLLMILTSATGAWIAGYQTYIQRVASDVQCSGEAAWWELFVDWAGEQAPLLFQASGLCSDPAWKLFGLSLAEYSLLIFSALTLYGIYLLLRQRA
ncbi:putative Disulfide bond formation protein B [Sterolibacterium denitrificans]|uniref:Disulfide bond formation protein B n=1 Tax=Sterolibacterium denitrificans TaxID=157592 RepID=A0A7Z7MV26_9PROT|nr:disulfide bond formation protein B [Sterolibacterium denitrificans]SMB23727.1 putative Disulfide bond formation protein B [Sterolibacterium denitrificans]